MWPALTVFRTAHPFDMAAGLATLVNLQPSSISGFGGSVVPLTTRPSVIDGVVRFVLPSTLAFLAALAMIVGFIHENPPTMDADRFHRVLLGVGVVALLVIADAGAYPLLAPILSLLVLALLQTIPQTRNRVATPVGRVVVAAAVLLGVAVGTALLLATGSSDRSWFVLAFRIVSLGAPIVALVGVGGALGRGGLPYGWVGVTTLTFAVIPGLFIEFSSTQGGFGGGLLLAVLPILGLGYGVVGTVPILLGYIITTSSAAESESTRGTA